MYVVFKQETGQVEVCIQNYINSENFNAIIKLQRQNMLVGQGQPRLSGSLHANYTKKIG